MLILALSRKNLIIGQTEILKRGQAQAFAKSVIELTIVPAQQNEQGEETSQQRNYSEGFRTLPSSLTL